MNLLNMTSNKPYLLRAFYEWILDNQMTPHIMVDVTGKNVKVPMQYAKDGKIILNIAPQATQHLQLENDWLSFNARFSGTAMQVYTPIDAILAIYARETGAGMFFDATMTDDDERNDGNSSNDTQPPNQSPPSGGGGKPKLTIVK